MRCSVLATAAVIFVACTSAHETTAHADQLEHPSGFTFELPNTGLPWAQEIRGDLIVLQDDTEKLPELLMFVFAAKKDGALADVVARLPAEVVRPGVDLIASGVKSAKLIGSSATESVADASVVTGQLLLNGRDKAVFAVIQRKGRSLIVVGVPKDGIYERGVSNFRAVIHGLKPSGAAPASRPGPPAPRKPPPPASTARVPSVAPFVGIKTVTATSTFNDRSNKDLYGAWRTLEYATALDRELGAHVPVTAWCEGKPDEGVAEGITIELAAPTPLDAIRIAVGVWKTSKLFAGNNRITALEVTVDGKTTTVKPAATRAWVEVPVRGTASSVTIKIGAIAKGKMNDSCISGIELVRGNKPLAVVRGIDAAAITELPRALAAIQGALAAPGRAGLDKLLDFPFSLHDIAGFAAGQPDALTYATWKAVAAACQRADKAGTPDAKLACPRAADVFEQEDRVLAVHPAGSSQLVVVFPSHAEIQEIWRLRWHDGAWHLAAIDYQPVE